nr:DNA methyltransferase [uncultured Roseibium sp.]
MTPTEMAEAVEELFSAPFHPAEFPYAFLLAFGNKETTIKKLRSGASNSSDVGGVLQRNNIHIGIAEPGKTAEMFQRLQDSPKTASAKAKFVLATDGETVEAQDLVRDDPLACTFEKFPDHFGFFLPLAGITTVKEVRESSFDIKATGRLNKLYIELLKENPDWGTPERRHDMNHFMARLIFCFFAEDTDIFHGDDLFTGTIDQMSARDSSNTHEVIGELFRAMNAKTDERASANLPRWANGFPYVNGGLFSGSTDVPRFSKIARSLLLHVGRLDWTQINPDIFGSMIQAIADDDERGSLGMHYTSVPNILKVLNPLFLDDLREKLEEAGDNPRKLLNLRNRLAKIRVFDPACGSGNFLVIAYKEIRTVEAEINRWRGEEGRKSDIPLTNFRGIELRDFPAEVARLALIIAEYQCDVLYRGQKEALAELLPLDAMNWITSGNSLRLDWLSVCPPNGASVKHHGEDLFHTLLDQPEIDFENEGGETYLCGNPQFKGARKQSKSQKEDMSAIFNGHKDYKDCDYVTAWFLKASEYLNFCDASFAFVSTSSISEGEQVQHMWSRLYASGCHIQFAHQTFKWRNNASNNAVVNCVIIGVSKSSNSSRILFEGDTRREVSSISPYLISGPEQYVLARKTPLSKQLGIMVNGSMPRDGGHLIMSENEARELVLDDEDCSILIKKFVGSKELAHYRNRYCLWITDDLLNVAEKNEQVRHRIHKVKEFRINSDAKTTNNYASIPHKFAQRAHEDTTLIGLSKTSSEARAYLPADIFTKSTIISDAAFAIYEASLWQFAIVISTLHRSWIATVCGRLKTDFRYSKMLGWNTFPVPILTEKNKADLTKCAENILLAREAHFPATIAELYDKDTTPHDLRIAHEQNDEVLERIYIGRKFRNDTERLEKLFELYTKMSGAVGKPAKTHPS